MRTISDRGKNEQVCTNTLTALDQLNTLRVFQKGSRNYGTLPMPSPTRYFIRASFYYGNYDGYSEAPTFDLEFNGNKWATVETSTIQYYKVIHTSHESNVSICLARNKQHPFILTLEI